MVEVECWKNFDPEGSGKNQEWKRSGCCVQHIVLVKQVNDS